MTKRVVIAGSGFGGLNLALKLKEAKKDLEVIVIDKNSFFTYIVSLHKLLAGSIRKKSILINLEKLYKKHNIKFYKEEIVQVKPLEKAIITKLKKINYDYLVLALGSVSQYRGIEGIEENAFNFKSVQDAENIREHVLKELKRSKHHKEPINMVVCGAGLTGVEVAGELADMTKHKAKTILIDALPTIMDGFDKESILYAEKTLKKKGVDIRTNSFITCVDPGQVRLKNKETIYSRTVIWCGGIKPNPVTYKTGLRTSDRGGLMVNNYLQTASPNVYAIGDCAYMYKNPQATTALIAMGHAETVVHNILADINNEEKQMFEANEVPYLVDVGKRKGLLVGKKTFSKGLLPAIMKKYVEKQYVMSRRFWKSPLKKLDVK